MNSDLISRSELLKLVPPEEIVARMAIMNAPTIEERPTGEWIYTDPEDKQKGYGGYCSICKCDMPIFMEDWQYKYCETKYCPNCGAKMKGADNDT